MLEKLLKKKEGNTINRIVYIDGIPAIKWDEFICKFSQEKTN